MPNELDVDSIKRKISNLEKQRDAEIKTVLDKYQSKFELLMIECGVYEKSKEVK